MEDDPIVAEVRKARAEILEEYGGDFDKMWEGLMANQWTSGRRVVAFDGEKMVEVKGPDDLPKSASATK